MMEALIRPPLADDVYEQIEVAQHQLDETYWPRLREMVVAPMEGFTAIGRDQPVRPRQPNRLFRILREYGCALFDVEAKQYPPSPKRKLWLGNLAKSIETRVMDAAAIYHMSSSETLTYHASANQMRHAIRQALESKIASYRSRALPGKKDASNRVTKPKQRRLPSSIGSPAAVRKMETYLSSNSMSLTEFAKKVQTTPRTLRRFRNTGKVRRGIFDEIATALGVTRQGLLKA